MRDNTHMHHTHKHIHKHTYAFILASMYVHVHVCKCIFCVQVCIKHKRICNLFNIYGSPHCTFYYKILFFVSLEISLKAKI